MKLETLIRTAKELWGGQDIVLYFPLGNRKFSSLYIKRRLRDGYGSNWFLQIPTYSGHARFCDTLEQLSEDLEYFVNSGFQHLPEGRRMF